MAKRTLELNGINFEVVNSETNTGLWIQSDVEFSEFKTIYELYDRPSITKISIYNEWVKWFNELDGGVTFGCIRGNCNFFSIGGLVRRDNELLYLFITKGHNRVVSVKGV